MALGPGVPRHACADCECEWIPGKGRCVECDGLNMVPSTYFTGVRLVARWDARDAQRGSQST